MGINHYNSYVFSLLLTFTICIWATGCFSCRSYERAGEESLVESRILAAVNAERNRWITDLSKQLTDGFTEIDKRISNIQDGLQQVATAAKEYRQFVLDFIDQLQQSQIKNTEIDNLFSNNNSNISSTGH